MIAKLPTIFLLLLLEIICIHGDDYTINSDNKSLLIAAGCFWCAGKSAFVYINMLSCICKAHVLTEVTTYLYLSSNPEQAFEVFAPGVVEAVSGYSGPNCIDNPSYKNHPGCYEVILIEYDPLQTTYKLMLEYAWRNIDPYSGSGQFCDRGPSYYPALFYATEEERVAAEEVKDEILEEYGWDESTLQVPLVERPKFWTAEDYHQNYYIKNPKNYGYYKNACGRTNRLKEVWGEDEYYCYHDYEGENFDTCFPELNGTITNEQGEEVEVVVNVKEASEEVVGLMPQWAVTFVSIVAAIFVCGFIMCCSFKWMRKDDDHRDEAVPQKELDDTIK